MIRLIVLLSILSFSIFAQEIVELKLPNSNKVIVKLRFHNGSICDPEGKEGITNITSNMITQGGTKDFTYSQIQDIIYPMTARYYSLVDKELTSISPKLKLALFFKFSLVR